MKATTGEQIYKTHVITTIIIECLPYYTTVLLITFEIILYNSVPVKKKYVSKYTISIFMHILYIIDLLD
jgi:hypothetical protein